MKCDCGHCKSCNDRRYYLRHKDKVKAKATAYRKANPDKVRAMKQASYQKNKDHYNDKSKAWYEDNKERHHFFGKLWVALNPEKRKSIRSKSQKLHPVQRATMKHKRRANMKGTYTEQEWLDLCERYGNMCLRCKRTEVKLTVDHVVPVSKGGTNTIDNIQPLCLSCNSWKRDKAIDYR